MEFIAAKVDGSHFAIRDFYSGGVGVGIEF
jgi:hypothetical protein